MGERSAGVLIAFAVVSIVALSVSFSAIAKMKQGQQQVRILKTEVEKLNEKEKNLQGSLQEAQQRYSQEAATTEDLKQVLSEMQRQNKPAHNADSTTQKKESSIATNFTSKSYTPKKNQ